MKYVATNTRDQWARDYLVQRLWDCGFDGTLKDPVKTWEDK